MDVETLTPDFTVPPIAPHQRSGIDLTRSALAEDRTGIVQPTQAKLVIRP